MYHILGQPRNNFVTRKNETIKKRRAMEKNNTPVKTQVYNLVILDKSGSMESIRKEAIDGYNETLGAIRAAQLKHMDTQDHFVSLAAFCDCGMDKLTNKQYEPCCCTPLFDAIGKTVKKLKADIKDIEDAAVLVTIITDGYENSSKEWSGPAIKKLIDDCKEEGWMFSFIGAGEDVVKVATTISITNTVVWEQTAEGTKEMFENENAAQGRFYDKMATCCSPSMSPSARKKMRKQFSEEYYDKDKK